MRRVLLVTNDFPPRVGGIQSYLRDFLDELDPRAVTVFASTQDHDAAQRYDADLPFDVVRWPHPILLPTPRVRRTLVRIVRERGIGTVWFGAAAPLAVLGGAARAAGADRIVATTHGHEVGWAMLPGARQVLRAIGRSCDVVSYISDYTLRRIRGAIGEQPRYVRLPSGVDTRAFRPGTRDENAATRTALGVGDAPLAVCVSRLVPRKGQDRLIRAWPEVRAAHPRARLLIIGRGRDERRLRRLAARCEGVTITGALGDAEMRAAVRAADVAVTPVRTRFGGLDVEGLGIVYLEAQASGVPVVAGSGGGAPETVTPETGIVVNGRRPHEIAVALMQLLADPERRRRLGAAGRRHAVEHWAKPVMGARLRAILDPAEG